MKSHLEQQLQLELPLDLVYGTKLSFSKDVCFLQGHVAMSKGEAVGGATLPPQSLAVWRQLLQCLQPSIRLFTCGPHSPDPGENVQERTPGP